MSLRGVHEKLDHLRSITGKGSQATKKELIESFVSSDPIFKEVLLLAMSSTKTYGIEDLGEFEVRKCESSPSEIFSYLNVLSSKKGTTDAEKSKLRNLCSTDEETFNVVQRVVMNNLQMDMGGKSVNDAVGYMLIYVVPYMRCHTTEKHAKDIIFPAFAQIKEDGAFLNGFINPAEKIFKFETREGNPIKQLKHLLVKLAKYKKPRATAGEILIIDGNGDPLPREANNGIINQCLQNSADPSDVSRIVYRTWDAIDYDDFWKGSGDVKYEDRYSDVAKACKIAGSTPLIKLVETRIVEDWDEVNEFYREARSRTPKQEGLVVKNMHALFKDGTSKDQQKLVNVSRAELRIVGWDYGTKHKRHQHVVGKLHLETDDGLVKVSIGQLSDKFRAQSEEELKALMSRICSVKYKSFSEPEETEFASLYLPRYDGIRYDRNTTDTINDLRNR